MTTTTDLRQAFAAIWSRAGMPAGEEETGEEGHASTDPPSPADDDSGAANLEEGDDDDVKNPRIKQLSDEAAKHRTNAKAEKDRADAAEARAKDLEAALNEVRMFNAFVVAAMGKVADFEAAWKLAEKGDVQLDDDGNVTGMDEMVEATLRKYPYLSPKPADDDPDSALVQKFPALQPSGRQTNGRSNVGAGMTMKALEAKFPALRRTRS